MLKTIKCYRSEFIHQNKNKREPTVAKKKAGQESSDRCNTGIAQISTAQGNSPLYAPCSKSNTLVTAARTSSVPCLTISAEPYPSSRAYINPSN